MALRETVRDIIFEADTPAGKAFDVILIICILGSVVAVMLDSVADIRFRYGEQLYQLEWFFTLLFTLEYLIRLLVINQPWRYARSFYGIIDLISVLPSYLSLLVAGSHYLIVIRILRVLRVFRVLKMTQYVGEASVLIKALKASSRKIAVFMLTITTLVTIFGSIMYLVESDNPQFSSIPKSVYWSIVTISTVGYGDISPQSVLGQMIASFVMVLGYAIIAVPTGIVTVELSNLIRPTLSDQVCAGCGKEGHDRNARFCKHCGEHLPDKKGDADHRIA